MDKRTGLPVVGMVGGGQLARMTHQAAIALGQSVRVLSVGPDESAALVARDVQLGTHTDLADLQALAQQCDVVTFDHEHVPGELIQRLEQAGVEVHPGSAALAHAQNKLVMRRRIADWGGAQQPRWAQVATVEDVVAFADDRWPVVLKAATGGYDGKGVWVVGSQDDAAEVVEAAAAGGFEILAEELVPLRREVAALVARSKFGQVSAWPVVETVQEDGICVEVIAPAPDLDEDDAAQITSVAIALATELGVTGVMAVEMFQTDDGRYLVNELAMRPHNSGHWSIDGSVTSQFEQHLRAVLDYPLGATTARAPYTVMANVLGGPDGGPGIDERVHHLMARWPELKIHLYGKQVRPGRKIGHVTAYGADLDRLRTITRQAARYLQEGTFDE
ncbi:5-(carboxyamino)imidazole ribonucleotide synthase [Cumulibacter manganitolerans]|uniref:5-(carboxyamino)imidazole ribonucleotide synthase n=1 Tax=Cumulibacter manganitolerans TaxID=1884992 RepID=UPI001295AE70|nr:5-(carboxyamino)imidazole ribonucleotide synthase [Cumulibacter manganitolerans]